MIKSLIKKLISILVVLGVAQKADVAGSKNEHRSQFRRHLDLVDYLDYVGFSRDIKILDIGCGMGLLAETLKNRGFEHVDGIDWLSESKVEKRKFLNKYTEIDLNQEKNIYQKLNNKYDLVVCSDVLEHLETPGIFTEGYVKVDSGKWRGGYNYSKCI